MTIEEMIKLKKEYGYSNQQISDKSGVPLGTVQKIFSGATTSPRFKTIKALSSVFDHKKVTYKTNLGDLESDGFVMEHSTYRVDSSAKKYNSNIHDKEGTVEEYLSFPEGTRVELIEGTFYDLAAPTTIHQRISFLLCSMFERYIDENGGECVPFVAPTDVQLNSDNKTMVQPDVMVVCDRDKIIKSRVVGAPDFIVEVLSPNNWYIDIVLKFNTYRNAGVKEYWIVLPEQKKVMVYFFDKSENYIEYSFKDKIPVSIWNGKFKVDFGLIYDKISFMYD